MVNGKVGQLVEDVAFPDDGVDQVGVACANNQHRTIQDTEDGKGVEIISLCQACDSLSSFKSELKTHLFSSVC